MTTAVEGSEWSATRPGRTLPPGKTRYPLYRRLVGPQVQSGRAENLVPTGIRSRTVQPLVAIPTELPGPHMVVVFMINRNIKQPTALNRIIIIIIIIINCVFFIIGKRIFLLRSLLMQGHNL
jgi:hypothetical protein